MKKAIFTESQFSTSVLLYADEHNIETLLNCNVDVSKWKTTFESFFKNGDKYEYERKRTKTITPVFDNITSCFKVCSEINYSALNEGEVSEYYWWKFPDKDYWIKIPENKSKNLLRKIS